MDDLLVSRHLCLLKKSREYPRRLTSKSSRINGLVLNLTELCQNLIFPGRLTSKSSPRKQKFQYFIKARRLICMSSQVTFAIGK